MTLGTGSAAGRAFGDQMPTAAQSHRLPLGSRETEITGEKFAANPITGITSLSLLTASRRLFAGPGPASALRRRCRPCGQMRIGVSRWERCLTALLRR